MICKDCSALIQVPGWLEIIGYQVHCEAGAHVIIFSLEGYQEAELARLERML
jgi:hypothetical protein